MKKNNLFKAVGIVILFYILMSWIVPIVYSIGGWKAEVSNQIGFISIINVVLETFSGFGSVILYVILVGAFYGVLKATGAYDKLIDFLSERSNGKEKVTLITTIVLMAIISSISGLDLGLLIVFPLLMGLIVKIGYDKMVALSATVGATIIGMYGATFAGTLYGANNTILKLDKYDQIIPKVVLFVAGLTALIVFVLLYIKNKELVKSTTNTKNVVKEEKISAKKSEKVKKNSSKTRKNVKPKKVERTKKETKECGAIPALVVIVNLLVVFILGTTNWGGIFKSNWFETAHNSWTGVKVGGFEILNKLFGGVDAFGSWFAPTRFQTYSLLLIIAMVAIVIIYRTSIEEAFEGFVDGIRSFVVPTILTILACSVFVLVYYNPFISPVTTALLKATTDFNVALTGIYTIINSVFYVDYYYLAYAVLASLTTVFDDSSILSVVSVMFANLYSLVMLVAPTSVILLISLSISDVKYTDWIKFIWKLAVALFVISFIVFTVMVLI